MQVARRTRPEGHFCGLQFIFSKGRSHFYFWMYAWVLAIKAWLVEQKALTPQLCEAVMVYLLKERNATGT